MSQERFPQNVLPVITLITVSALVIAATACSKSSSSGGDKASVFASADPPNVALSTASADAPRATPNSTAGAQAQLGGAGAWDHHCDVAATRTCVEWAQADKGECDAAHGTYGAGPCVRTAAVLGTCVLAVGTTTTGDPAPAKRILYLAGAGGAMKADSAHAMCDREQLASALNLTHMWKDGPASLRK